MLLPLFLPKGVWGVVQLRWEVHLRSAGYRVRGTPHASGYAPRRKKSQCYKLHSKQ